MTPRSSPSASWRAAATRLVRRPDVIAAVRRLGHPPAFQARVRAPDGSSQNGVRGGIQTPSFRVRSAASCSVGPPERNGAVDGQRSRNLLTGSQALCRLSYHRMERMTRLERASSGWRPEVLPIGRHSHVNSLTSIKIMAGRRGLEPRSSVLETDILAARRSARISFWLFSCQRPISLGGRGGSNPDLAIHSRVSCQLNDSPHTLEPRHGLEP